MNLTDQILLKLIRFAKKKFTQQFAVVINLFLKLRKQNTVKKDMLEIFKS